MSEMTYSARLRELSKNYYQSHIGFEEYRSLRKEVLDKIDEEFNGYKPVAGSSDMSESGTESSESSLLMKTVAFFKNKDIED